MYLIDLDLWLAWPARRLEVPLELGVVHHSAKVLFATASDGIGTSPLADYAAISTSSGGIRTPAPKWDFEEEQRCRVVAGVSSIARVTVRA